MINKFHYFVKLKERPWALIISIRLINNIISLLLTIKSSGFINLNISLVSTYACMYMWWREFSIEIDLNGRETTNIEKLIKNGILIFITSEIIVFLRIFWRYYQFYLSPIINLGIEWPPKRLIIFRHLDIPIINTILLVSSRITLTFSHKIALTNKEKLERINLNKFFQLIKLTLTIGLIFTFIQIIEYNFSFFSINDSRFGRVFYMITGLHGVHVIIGTIYLNWCYVKIRKNFYGKSKNWARFEISCWYWHFVDFIWILVYYSVYFLRN